MFFDARPSLVLPCCLPAFFTSVTIAFDRFVLHYGRSTRSLTLWKTERGKTSSSTVLKAAYLQLLSPIAVITYKNDACSGSRRPFSLMQLLINPSGFLKAGGTGSRACGFDAASIQSSIFGSMFPMDSSCSSLRLTSQKASSTQLIWLSARNCLFLTISEILVSSRRRSWLRPIGASYFMSSSSDSIVYWINSDSLGMNVSARVFWYRLDGCLALYSTTRSHSLLQTCSPSSAGASLYFLLIARLALLMTSYESTKSGFPSTFSMSRLSSFQRLNFHAISNESFRLTFEAIQAFASVSFSSFSAKSFPSSLSLTYFSVDRQGT